MGLFTYQPAERKVKGFAGHDARAPMYLQFVTGYCVEVCHSGASLEHKASNHTNTIMAKTHQNNKVFESQATSLSEDNRYYPLFRTTHDVPSKGDPVLLTSFEGVNYYLGPLNMPGNSPTWNDDGIQVPEISVNKFSGLGVTTQSGTTGESENFNKEIEYNRLQKVRNDELDYGDDVIDVVGDYLIEGRHGNSLRIGSRSDDPYVFLSNARDSKMTVETLSDGTLISITSNGTLAQHFGATNLDSTESQIPFKLASDSIVDDPNPFPIGDIHSDLNNGADIQETIYEYDENQILIQSDRLTLNSKLDDIFISSIKDIHIGSHRNITLSSGREMDLIASTVYIGNPYRGSETQPMVLGDILKEVLTEMVDFFTTAKIFTGQVGSQSFQMDPAFATIQPKLNQIRKKIETITSNFHEIEGN